MTSEIVGAVAGLWRFPVKSMTAFPDMQVLLDDLRFQEDRIIYHWTLTGTNTGTGGAVRISGFEIWQMGPDGLIADSRGHFDSADYHRQLGLETHQA